MLSKTGPPLSGLHDVELATLAAAGDRSAFDELVRRHGSTVRGLLRRMGADAPLADDLAQDALLSAYEHIAEFRGQGAFSAWLRRIAARLYLRHWRRGSRLQTTTAADDDGQITSWDESAAALHLDLDEALGLLSDSERLCVSLCYGAGLSHAEAAAALKTPIGTVKSHVRRGLDKLRMRLKPPGDTHMRSGPLE